MNTIENKSLKENLPRLVGVIHLPPLPGSPRAQETSQKQMQNLIEWVKQDITVLAEVGFEAVILENFGDVPFCPSQVEPIVLAAMTRCVQVACEASSMKVGVNVLRNDALSALAIAAACSASFLRVNVHVGAVVSDQGLLEGMAYQTLRTRKAWGAENIDIWADVDVKHASQLAPRALQDLAHDTFERGLANALLVTGAATGAAPNKKDVETISKVGAPVYVASGVTPENLSGYVKAGAHGVIVGSWLRSNQRAGGPIDFHQAKIFAQRARDIF